MIKKMPTTHIIALLLTSLLCLNSYAEPHNLSKLKAQVIRYHDSGAYQKDIEIVAAKAMRYIDAQVHINTHVKNPKKLALVLDIDETCLSHYAQMRTNDFAELHHLIDQQYLEADAPAIQSMLTLYQHALQQGVSVFFITGRDKHLKDATIRNLYKAGYANWSGLDLKPQPGSVAAYKTAVRARITQEGYTIIASIGDQYSDLVGGYAQKTFKLPNPYYYIPSDNKELHSNKKTQTH